MKAVTGVVLALVACWSAGAQHTRTPEDGGTATLMPGLGDVHHAVSAKNSEAQRFFDQGLALIYAFNHDEALRSFERAAALDPECAMAWWGIALAVGPNYNDPEPDLAREKKAWEAIQKASALESKATEPERGYIEALAHRYSNQAKPDLKRLAADYKIAMGELTKRYPDDLDAATLYAESAMDLRPWQLWTADGKPAEGTEEIVATLESVLKRDPQHTGANHFYIHAVEASPHPERALPSAGRLAQLAPAAGHLVHMPAHIYMRTGDYAGATHHNEQAVEADRQYIRKFNVTGMYPLMYYNHNLHFLAVAAAMEGRFAEARQAAKELVANAAPVVKEMPMAEYFLPTEMLVLVRFNRWEDILKLAEPDAAAPTAHALWRFARGMAYCGLEKVRDAEAERQALVHAAANLAPEAVLNFNSSSDLLSLAAHLLEGRIAMLRVSIPAAVEHFRKAAEIEDALRYDEPPAWYIPARESLARALMTASRYPEAEQVLREDLMHHPHSGRALFGLWQCLKSEGKGAEAKKAEAEFRAAWKNADVKLRIEDL
jgi:tetratricopeptide (TPR) repeat protein